MLSFGSNTVRLLVVRDAADGSVEELEHRQAGTRLGEGLCDGEPLSPVAVARTLLVAREFAAVAHEYGAKLSCIATSAVRRSGDGEAFAGRVADVTGAPLRVLSGAEEAAASYRGATYGVAHDGSRTAVLDIGGGSTECAVGTDGVLAAARSLEIGSVRVAERYPAIAGGEPGPVARAAAVDARAFVAGAVAPLRSFAPVAQVRCVAGTPLTIAAVIAGSHVDAVSGSFLRRDELDATIDRLLDLHLDERRVLAGMLAQRADIIVGGALVLSEAMRALDVEAGLLESNDLLLGFLLAPE
ncbi:MAG: Ppx/GppA phosphatase family protein [Vulcanimicrobiaceae bacterium]